MKIVPFALSFALCASAFAESVAVPRLPAPTYLDTEVSTNVVFSLPEKCNTFTVGLSLNATPSNNVQIAFGRGDGELPSLEAGLTLGWDCGKWFLETPDAMTRLEAEPAGTNLFKTVSLVLSLRSNGTVREATITDGTTRLFANEPLAFSNSTSWNLLKATARGFGTPNEAFTILSTINGTRLIFR